jgi:outer membrane PBP1 activator LpoA protein
LPIGVATINKLPGDCVMQGMLPAAGHKVQSCFTVLVVALLVGCVDPTIYRPNTQAPQERRALEAESESRHSEAADLYAQLARTAQGDERINYLIRSAEQLLTAGQPAAAQQRLATAASPSDPGVQARLTVTQGHIDLVNGAPQRALDRIDGLGAAIPTSLIGSALRVRGGALFQLDRPTEAVTTLVERETWLTRSEQVLANHRQIWEGLKDTVLLMPPPSTNPEVNGWLSLLPAAQHANVAPLGIKQALLDWRVQQPRHPAANGLVAELLNQIRELTDYPEQIAVLLPLGGRQQAAATALRDGMLAAHWSDVGTTRPRIKIYDTDSYGAGEAYSQALLEGADFVVGPLLKNAVETVAQAAGSIPTLALNYLDEMYQVQPGFFQFALAPEDEAREIAQQAVAAGHLNAVALVPNNDWGTRILTSFGQELESFGGQLLEFRGYQSGVEDFSGSITSLFKLTESNQRYRRLAANLGRNVEFEPRRRQDVDFIFFAANARAGRLLMPQLRFYYAGDLPTYSTSETFEPGGRGNNNELNGIMYPDAPWLIAPTGGGAAVRATVERHWPRRGVRFSRLYAMGFDAYRLIPLLNRGDPSQILYRGMSGVLSLDREGRIHRQLEFAQIQGGVPQPLEPTVAGEEVVSAEEF